MPKRPKHKKTPSTRKLPVAAETLASTKEPSALFGTDPMRLTPAWRVSLMEMVTPFGWHEIGPEKLREVQGKLKDFESMTWHEILTTSRHRNHPISVDQLCKEARDRLEAIGQNDIEELVSLRLSGPERVWGIRSEHVLKILWWDPAHSVCPSLKKHT